MKNILFILHLPPPVHGSSRVGLLIKESTLINNAFECRYINILASRKLNETGQTSYQKIFRFVGLWFQLLIEIIKKKPDICYMALTSTRAAFYRDVLLVALLRFFRIKRVYHLHNKGVKRCQRSKINRLLYRFVFKDADIIILSKLLYKDIKTYVPVSRVYICPNGVEETPANIKNRKIKPEDPVQILFLSNLILSKGIVVLLDACSLLKEKKIDFKCHLIGGEDELNAFQLNDYVKQKGLEEHVDYLGMKYGREKRAAFARADIFAFPTCNDCFPLVLLEAMCDGLPVVSTFEGGIPDIVEEGITGFLVPQRNAKALAEKLEVLIKNPELRQQMGKAGRLKYKKEFTLEIFEQRLKNILQHLSYQE
ncbi:MAG: glycosyltransferase family 4 protein [Bacteroidota bacterium]|nr:glycosyltransferase family 4 protein [Bacteroidota bacterium]